MKPDELEKLEEVYNFIQSLKNSTTIPLEIDQSFKARFSSQGLSPSGKSATSENRLVDEGGSATYSVLKAPDAFLQVTVNGGTYYVPVFT